MKQPIRKGGVFMVPDKALSLPPNNAREYHGQRPVIVISGDAKNADDSWPHVLVIPTSSSGRLATEFCVKLAYGTANLTSKCWARVVMPQPIEKADFGAYLGTMPAEILDMIEGNLFAYMGLTD